MEGENQETFRWVEVKDRDEIEELYHSVLPKVREAARKCGYAIGLHGSMRRDLDLIAVPWREGASDKDTLAKELHKAACGITMSRYEWESKPFGRVATCFPICFPSWNEPSLGHIDLSVVPMTMQTEQESK